MSGERPNFYQLLTYLLLGGLVFWAINNSSGAWTGQLIQVLLANSQKFYSDHSALTILLFCTAHWISSALSLPGSCTFLNIWAGAIFGFWLGCSIVYPITMISAAFSYLLASQLYRLPMAQRYSGQLEFLKKKLEARDYPFFVALRLSPFLPFGMLNVLMGALRIPKRLYYFSTFAGIFFDVTLLNNIGAGLAANNSQQNIKNLTLSFLFLFLALLAIHLFVQKRMNAQTAHLMGRES